MAKKHCEHCGASIVEYPFNFNKGLAACLKKMQPYFFKPVEISTLSLTKSQWTNFQKLRYWGLIEPYRDVENNRKGGWWQLTLEGKQFLNGGRIHQKVWMFRNEFVRWDGNFITLAEVDDDYDYRPDYAEKAEPAREFDHE